MSQNNTRLTLWYPADLNADLISLGGDESRNYHLTLSQLRESYKKIHLNPFNADTETQLIVCIA